MRDEMIFNRICNDSLGLALASSPSDSYNFLTEKLIQFNFFKDHGGPILPYLEVVKFTKFVINLV